MSRKQQRLIVVSNRLPFVFERGREGRWGARPGSGGLVTALVPVLRNRGGIWIGWAGASGSAPDMGRDLAALGTRAGYTLRGVPLDDEEIRGFYEGFSNEVIWPLFHDLQSLCNFDPEYWRIYGDVNRKYARIVDDAASERDFVWVHDYHLMNVGAELQRLGSTARRGFFLHIPFPPLDIFLKLPWRREILDALTYYDLIGFQTAHDRHNFGQCVRAMLGDVRVERRGQVHVYTIGPRTVRVGAFPISIDFNAFLREASTLEIAAGARAMHEHLRNRKLILGIDRLDYTKGIALRLRAFESALKRYPKLRERMSLIQVVVPSREDIPAYREMRSEIEQLVSQINGTYSTVGGWVPVWYAYRSLSRRELLEYYRAADIALVTPLKDGMNLVAKEYCACSIEEDCVLILSEFAGAAEQLAPGAMLVNPYDIDGVADAIHTACEMDAPQRKARMRRLRRSVRRYDVFWWVDTFLRAAITEDLRAFPAQPVRPQRSEEHHYQYWNAASSGDD